MFGKVKHFPYKDKNLRRIPLRPDDIMASPKSLPQFYRKVLPETCISFCSPEGKKLFTESLLAGYMNSYFGLAAQFRTQDEPAFCGLSTLVMALNTLEVDPKRVWKGPWRWYHEEMLDCCTPLEVVKKKGITLDQFSCLASCNTLYVKTVRVKLSDTEDNFRTAVESCTKGDQEVLVASYSRRVLGQTGDGHFSPLAGYHPDADMVLIMDTARFKYPPHWVKLPLLFESMKATDKDTGMSRGYVILSKSNQKALVLFRVSPQLSITLPDDNNPAIDIMPIIQLWLSWLQQQQPEPNSQSLDSIVQEAIVWIGENLPTVSESIFLTTQVDVRCHEKLSSEHRCAAKELIQAVEQTTLYQIIDAILKQSSSLANSVSEKIGSPATSTNLLCSSCEQNASCTMPKLTTSHFVAIFLISWPYTKCKGTRGLSLQQAASLQLSQAADVLKNEVNQLRLQLNTVIRFMKSCENCQCFAAIDP